MRNLKIGVYKHYKGKEYKVLGVVRHSESLEEMVLYEALYDNELGNLWVRPLKMFLSTVTIGGKTISRFEFIRI